MRFICVMLLHVQIEGSVRQTLDMFRYQLNHTENFVNIRGESTFSTGLLLIFMQFGSSIATEVINLLIIIEASDPKEALMNFIALEIISQIDDIYYSTLRQEPLKNCITQSPPVIENTTKSLRAKGLLKPGFSLKRSIYQIVMFGYAVYFYFLPLVVPFVSYVSPEIGMIEKELKDLQN